VQTVAGARGKSAGLCRARTVYMIAAFITLLSCYSGGSGSSTTMWGRTVTTAHEVLRRCSSARGQGFGACWRFLRLASIKYVIVSTLDRGCPYEDAVVNGPQPIEVCL
jgi:hypothetical protein